MNKEEFIARYGLDAWNKKNENSRLYHAKRKLEDPEWYKNRIIKAKEHTAKHKKKWLENHREEYKKSQLDHYYKCKQDDTFMRERAEKSRINAQKRRELLADAGGFVNAQYTGITKAHVTNWEQYTLDLLSNEANNVDCDERLLDENFLYERFIDNKQNGMFYGNLQVLKYFVLLMCLKVYRDEPFSVQNIEMIKYFDNLENNTNKKPIAYSSIPYFLPREYINNKEKATIMMLLYNLSADFMHNRSRYPTDKKLY